MGLDGSNLGSRPFWVGWVFDGLDAGNRLGGCEMSRTFFVRWYVRFDNSTPPATGKSSEWMDEWNAWKAANEALEASAGCPSTHAPLARLWYAVGEIVDGKEIETMATNTLEGFLAERRKSNV